MFKIVSSLCAAAMALSVPMIAPAVAMPISAPTWTQDGATNVQYRDEDGRYRGWRGGYQRRGNDAFYNGHRGYRQQRRGYRQHNGFWFPPAAFIAGAIIGGAIGNQSPPVRVRPGGNAHVEWCYDRYRSYRASDNSFQPYNGARRQCRSPYG